MTRNNFEKERLKLVNDLEVQLNKRVSSAQGKLYTKVLELISELDLDDGAIKFTTANINKQKKIRTIIDSFNKTTLSGVVTWLINRVKDVVKVNKKYFATMTDGLTATAKKVEANILKSLGFEKGKLIKDSRLFNLLNDNSTAAKLTSVINKGINGNQTITRLREGVKKLVVNDNGLGDLQRRFKQSANDVFAEADRATQLQYANELNYNFLIWGHTIFDGSTTFCRERSNRLYTREFAVAWDFELDWKGKKDGNNVLIDGHGHNCRATVNWISDQLAAQFEKTIGLNIYN